jgi:hypothetical protein
MQGGELRTHRVAEVASALYAGKEFGNWGFGELSGWWFAVVIMRTMYNKLQSLGISQRIKKKRRRRRLGDLDHARRRILL